MVCGGGGGERIPDTMRSIGSLKAFQNAVRGRRF